MNLRPYQVESVEALRAEMRAGHKRQVLAAATGAGKSVMMLELIRSAQQKNSRVLFVCERRILVEQFSKHLDSIGIDHGILMAKHWRFRPEALVQVASAQTLEKMETWPAFDIVFIDELHACMRKSVVGMLKTFSHVPVIGSTATPFHPEIVEHFTSVTSVISMEQLVADGNLVPFRVFVAKEIDTAGVKLVAGEFKKDELERRGKLIVGDIVEDYVKISHDVFGGYRKTICFSCGVGHGADLVEQFQGAGINAVQISYKDTDEYKADVLADFAKPDTQIQIVVSADILTRGYDQTDVEHVILARPLKKSFSAHVQMVGRGARPHAGKALCVIQDNSGNWLRFQESWDELYAKGVKELTSATDAKPRKEPSEKEKAAAKCPVCRALWMGGDTCSFCGHVRPKINQATTVPGEMVELGKREKVSSEDKQRWFAELLGHARRRGFSDGWASHKYREKFGVWPAKKCEPSPYLSQDVDDYIRYLNIKWAKSKKTVTRDWQYGDVRG